LSAAELAVLAAGAVLASITQSVSGFGFGVVLVGLMPVFGVKILDIVVLVGILVIPNLAIGLWRLRRHASLRRIAWLLVGVPLGIPLGMMLQASGSEAVVRGLLGGVLLFAAIEPFFRGELGPRPTRPVWAILTGTLSGTLGAAFGTGGPPVVIYYYRRHWSKEVTKASLLLTYSFTVALRTVPYVAVGWLTLRLLLIGLALCPVVAVASTLGERIFHRCSQSAFRKVVAAMLILLGLYQIGKAVGAW
jgi:hypothetical protein